MVIILVIVDVINVLVSAIQGSDTEVQNIITFVVLGLFLMELTLREVRARTQRPDSLNLWGLTAPHSPQPARVGPLNLSPQLPSPQPLARAVSASRWPEPLARAVGAAQCCTPATGQALSLEHTTPSGQVLSVSGLGSRV